MEQSTEPDSPAFLGSPCLNFSSGVEPAANLRSQIPLNQHLLLYSSSHGVAVHGSSNHGGEEPSHDVQLAAISFAIPRSKDECHHIKVVFQTISPELVVSRQRYNRSRTPEALPDTTESAGRKITLYDMDEVKIWNKGQEVCVFTLDTSGVVEARPKFEPTMPLVASSDCGNAPEMEVFHTPAEAGAVHSLRSHPSVIKETPATSRIIPVPKDISFASDVQSEKARVASPPRKRQNAAETVAVPNKRSKKSPPAEPKTVIKEESSPDLEADPKDTDNDEDTRPPKPEVNKKVKTPRLNTKSTRKATPTIAIAKIHARERSKKALEPDDVGKDADQSLPNSSHPSNGQTSAKLTVAFSGCDLPPATQKLIKKLASIQDDVDDSTDALCISNGALKLTSKLLKARALGKRIVDERWVQACAKSNKMVDLSPFTAKVDEDGRKKALPENWSAGVPIPKIFQSKTVYITPVLKKIYGGSYVTIQWLLAHLNATKVVSHVSKDVPKDYEACSPNTMIIIAVDDTDKDGLHIAKNHDIPVYYKEIISFSILRGKLDLDSDEFRMVPSRSRKGGSK